MVRDYRHEMTRQAQKSKLTRMLPGSREVDTRGRLDRADTARCGGQKVPR